MNSRYCARALSTCSRQCRHQPEGEVQTSARILCSQSWSRDLPPNLKSVLHLLSIGGRGQPMAVWAEVLGDRAIGCKEPLGLAPRLKALPVPLPLACRLVRILRPIVQIA